MTTLSIEEAQANLGEVIHGLDPGDELVITEGDRPVARLTRDPSEQARPIPRLGALRGTVLSMEHFDDPLEEFEEYT